MNTDFATKLIDFAEKGNQQKITLETGEILQGWIMEITDEQLLMRTGYGDKNGKDIWLDFSQIQTAQLEYWDSQTSQWLLFK